MGQHGQQLQSIRDCDAARQPLCSASTGRSWAAQTQQDARRGSRASEAGRWSGDSAVCAPFLARSPSRSPNCGARLSPPRFWTAGRLAVPWCHWPSRLFPALQLSWPWASPSSAAASSGGGTARCSPYPSFVARSSYHSLTVGKTSDQPCLGRIACSLLAPRRFLSLWGCGWKWYKGPRPMASY